MTPALSQDNNKAATYEKIESMKKAFITQSLEMSADELKQFWPLYNEYQEAKRQIKERFSDAAAGDEIQKEEQLLDLKKTYYTKFGDVLPEGKLDALTNAEKQFKRKLMEEAQKRR